MAAWRWWDFCCLCLSQPIWQHVPSCGYVCFGQPGSFSILIFFFLWNWAVCFRLSSTLPFSKILNISTCQTLFIPGLIQSFPMAWISLLCKMPPLFRRRWIKPFRNSLVDFKLHFLFYSLFLQSFFPPLRRCCFCPCCCPSCSWTWTCTSCCCCSWRERERTRTPSCWRPWWWRRARKRARCSSWWKRPGCWCCWWSRFWWSKQLQWRRCWTRSRACCWTCRDIF